MGPSAVTLYEVGTVKPVELDRLKNAIARLTPAADATPARVERIPVEKAGKKLLVNVDDMKVIEANAKAFELFGRDPESMSDLDLENLFAPAQREATISGILSQLSTITLFPFKALITI